VSRTPVPADCSNLGLRSCLGQVLGTAFAATEYAWSTTAENSRWTAELRRLPRKSGTRDPARAAAPVSGGWLARSRRSGRHSIALACEPHRGHPGKRCLPCQSRRRSRARAFLARRTARLSLARFVAGCCPKAVPAAG